MSYSGTDSDGSANTPTDQQTLKDLVEVFSKDSPNKNVARIAAALTLMCAETTAARQALEKIANFLGSIDVTMMTESFHPFRER